MPRTNYLIKFDFSYHRQLAKPCLIVSRTCSVTASFMRQSIDSEAEKEEF